METLYDHTSVPREWTHLAGKRDYARKKQDLSEKLNEQINLNDS